MNGEGNYLLQLVWTERALKKKKLSLKEHINSKLNGNIQYLWKQSLWPGPWSCGFQALQKWLLRFSSMWAAGCFSEAPEMWTSPSALPKSSPKRQKSAPLAMFHIHRTRRIRCCVFWLVSAMAPLISVILCPKAPTSLWSQLDPGSWQPWRWIWQSYPRNPLHWNKVL